MKLSRILFTIIVSIYGLSVYATDDMQNLLAPQSDQQPTNQMRAVRKLIDESPTSIPMKVQALAAKVYLLEKIFGQTLPLGETPPDITEIVKSSVEMLGDSTEVPSVEAVEPMVETSIAKIRAANTIYDLEKPEEEISTQYITFLVKYSPNLSLLIKQGKHLPAVQQFNHYLTLENEFDKNMPSQQQLDNQTLTKEHQQYLDSLKQQPEYIRWASEHPGLAESKDAPYEYRKNLIDKEESAYADKSYQDLRSRSEKNISDFWKSHPELQKNYPNKINAEYANKARSMVTSDDVSEIEPGILLETYTLDD